MCNLPGTARFATRAKITTTEHQSARLRATVSQQSEKFLFQQSRKFLFETGRLAG